MCGVPPPAGEALAPTTNRVAISGRPRIHHLVGVLRAIGTAHRRNVAAPTRFKSASVRFRGGAPERSALPAQDLTRHQWTVSPGVHQCVDHRTRILTGRQPVGRGPKRVATPGHIANDRRSAPGSSEGLAPERRARSPGDDHHRDHTDQHTETAATEGRGGDPPGRWDPRGRIRNDLEPELLRPTVPRLRDPALVDPALVDPAPVNPAHLDPALRAPRLRESTPGIGWLFGDHDSGHVTAPSEAESEKRDSRIESWG